MTHVGMSTWKMCVLRHVTNSELENNFVRSKICTLRIVCFLIMHTNMSNLCSFNNENKFRE